MTDDLQQLLEKIQHEGVEKAQTEADQILAAAREKAKALTDTAQQEAARIKTNAQQEADAFARRAEETIRQAARDTVLQVEKSVNNLLNAILLKDVNAALSDAQIVAPLAVEAVRAYLAGSDKLDVATSDKLVDALRKALAAEAEKGVTVVTDETVNAGFRIRLAGGRVEQDFTGAAVAEALSQHLRPRLAALLK